MAKRKLTLQEHLNHPNYGFRFGLVLKHLEEQYSWDTEEITSEEDVILVITLSLEQNIPPAKIAEQLDAQLKAKEEEEIEPISAPTKSVGMFESDLWEHEIPRAPMHGPWTLPPAKGGFLHTPRIESPRSSPHYVPTWQKIRIYAQDLLDRGISKTIKEIAEDLGQKRGYVSMILRGTIEQPHTKHAQANPGLPRIDVAMSDAMHKSVATKRLTGTIGDQSQSYEKRQEIAEEIINTFIERMTQDEERNQYEIVQELAKEHNIGPVTVIRLLGDIYDLELMAEQRVTKSSESPLISKGTSYEEIRKYLKEFGSDFTDNAIAAALNVSHDTVATQRRQLNIPRIPIEGLTSRKVREMREQNPKIKVKEMSDKLGITDSAIYLHLRKSGRTHRHHREE